MPGLLLHTGAAMTCFHGVPAQIPPAQPRVLVSGQPVATVAGTIAVAGCPFTLPNGKPQPCVTIRWTMPSARVLVAGSPALLQPSPGPGPGMCLSPEQIPQGAPFVTALQPRVLAT
jgi:hypothetical protein